MKEHKKPLVCSMMKVSTAIFVEEASRLTTL